MELRDILYERAMYMGNILKNPMAEMPGSPRCSVGAGPGLVDSCYLQKWRAREPTMQQRKSTIPDILVMVTWRFPRLFWVLWSSTSLLGPVPLFPVTLALLIYESRISPFLTSLPHPPGEIQR